MEEAFKDKQLTRMYINYRQGELEWKVLKEEAEYYCYSLALRYLKDRDDLFTIYIDRYFHQIPGLIKRFKFKGAPLEHFLTKSVIFRCKNILNRDRKMKYKRMITQLDEVLESCREQHEKYRPESMVETDSRENLSSLGEKQLKTNAQGKVCKGWAKKRLILLLLREAYRVDDRHIRQVADATSVDRYQLEEEIHQLRKRIHEKKERAALLFQRRNASYTKLISLECRLYACQNPEEESGLRERIEKQKEKLLRLDRSIQKKRWQASQSEIAQASHLPRGTVGSALYYLLRGCQAEEEQKR